MKVFWSFLKFFFIFIRNPAETIGKRLTWCVSCHRGWNPWKRYQCKSLGETFSFPWFPPPPRSTFLPVSTHWALSLSAHVENMIIRLINFLQSSFSVKSSSERSEMSVFTLCFLLLLQTFLAKRNHASL